MERWQIWKKLHNEGAELHILIALLLVLLIGLFTSLTTALIVCVVVSLGKELVDKFIRKTKFSYIDLGADLVGVVVGAGILLIMTYR